MEHETLMEYGECLYESPDIEIWSLHDKHYRAYMHDQRGFCLGVVEIPDDEFPGVCAFFGIEK